jgi:hypothetical protein
VIASQIPCAVSGEDVASAEVACAHRCLLLTDFPDRVAKLRDHHPKKENSCCAEATGEDPATVDAPAI